MTTQAEGTAIDQVVAPVATPTTAPVKAAGFSPLGAGPVVAVKPEGGKSVIRQYEGKDSGFIVIQQTTIDFSNPTWPKPKLRSTLMKGKVEWLKQLVEVMVDKKTLAMPGKLILHEVLYTQAFRDEIEAARDKSTYRKSKEFGDLIADLNLTSEDEDVVLKDVLKRAGKNGPILTKSVGDEDVWILKFTKYQPAPDENENYRADILVAHDNHEEIADYRAENPQDGAALPGGEEN